MAFRLTMVSDVRDVIRGTDNIADGLDEVADALDDVASESTGAGRDLARSLDTAGDAADDLASAARDAGRDVERALDDAGDSATDLARTGREAGDDLGRGVSDGAETAEDATTRMERTFSESVRAMRDDSSSVGDGLGEGIRDGADRVSEGTEQMRDDAMSNATEMAAGFDGSVGSMTDAAQGFIAEGLSGFGPAGAAAGLAAGIGIGLVTSHLESAKEEAEETAEQVAGIAGELIDLRASTRGPEAVRDALKEMATTSEEGEIAIEQHAEVARRAGIDFGTYAAALAGDAEAQGRAYEEIIGAQLRALDRYNQMRKTDFVAAEEYLKSRQAERDALSDAAGELEKVNGLLDQGASASALYTEAVDASSAAQLDSAEATEEATAAAEDQTSAAEELVTATEAVTQATRDQASAALEASNAQIGFAAAVSDATETISENGATLDISTEAGRENYSALNGLAGQTLSLAEANRINGAATEESNAKLVEGRTAFINAAEAAGATAEEAQHLADTYGLVPEVVVTDAQVTGVQKAKDDLADVSKDREVKITPYANAWEFQKAVDSAAAGLRPPNVALNPRAGTYFG